jgi:hypothetical protein
VKGFKTPFTVIREDYWSWTTLWNMALLQTGTIWKQFGHTPSKMSSRWTVRNGRYSRLHFEWQGLVGYANRATTKSQEKPRNNARDYVRDFRSASFVHCNSGSVVAVLLRVDNRACAGFWRSHFQSWLKLTNRQME